MSLALSDLPWYVVHARPRQELLAAAVLQTRLELPTWVPEVKQYGRPQPSPLFPGYLFVQAGEAGLPMSAINNMPGVVRVVAFELAPQPMPAATVAALRSQVDAVNARGGLPQHTFHPGEAVRISRGPLAGMEALFVGPTTPAARVAVLLQFLGSQRTVHVAPDELERVANPAVAHPPRRSRGRGRPIRAAMAGDRREDRQVDQQKG